VLSKLFGFVVHYYQYI